MKIALIGYGKMGQLIEKLAVQQKHEIIARFTQQTPLSNTISQADVVIDFSQASAVIKNLQFALSYQKPMIIGSTGWEQSISTAEELVSKANGCCLYSPNFSRGVYLFRQIVRQASLLLEPCSDYDVCGVEFHHRQKLDHPSGTAKALTEDITQCMPRISTFAFESVRCGSIPGTHTIKFDSPIDTLTLTHEARSREGFAEGAIAAGQWLIGKKGFFTMDDFMKDLLKK